MLQKRLGLSLSPLPSETNRQFRFRVGNFHDRLKSEDSDTSISPQKLLCDLLKRQARAAMADVTRCEAHSIPANLARLEAVCDVCEHLFRHDLKHTPESSLSGRQLAYPTTLADFVACMELTKKNHRCPEFVNPEDDKFSQIITRLDTLAFFVSKNAQTNGIESEVVA